MQTTRIIYFGTPQFAADVLQGLHNDTRIKIELVVTGSAKARGRHSSVPTPVATTATSLSIPVFETDDPKSPELLEKIESIHPDLGVIVAWRILPESVYSSPRLGTVNLHGSLLPKYRGAAPIQRAIWNGELETGMTVFLLDKGIDTGNVLLSQIIPIDPLDTSGDLFNRFAPLGVVLLQKAITGLTEGILTLHQQSSESATPAPKIKPDERRIDWAYNSNNLRCQIHALSPEPGAVTNYGDIRVIILRVREIYNEENREPGTIVIDKKHLRVATGDGWLQIDEIAREGKKAMSGVEFSRGIQQWNGGKFVSRK